MNAPSASGWANGDFNYDGFISADDYTAIDFNLVAQGTPFPVSSSLSGVAAVPEPGLGLAVLVAAAGVFSAGARSRRREPSRREPGAAWRRHR